jgi:uncharacterized cupredoxin-like copper-binding protein
MPVVLLSGACSKSDDAASPFRSDTTTAVVTGGDVSVSLNQWTITPSATTVPAGSVTFDVSNDGTITHEFVVLQTDTPASEIPIKSFEDEPERINEDTAGTNIGETGDMEAGAAQTLALDLAPGHYVFVCNLPSHYGEGMHVDFTVA